MIAFSSSGVRLGQHGHRAAARVDALQAGIERGGREYDPALRAPRRAARRSVQRHHGCRRSTGDRDLPQSVKLFST